MTQMMPNLWTIILMMSITIMKLSMMNHFFKMNKTEIKMKLNEMKW